MPSQLFNLYTSNNGTLTESQAKISSLDIASDEYNSIIFDTKRHSIWAQGEEYGRGSDAFDKAANSWTATIQGQTWSRILYVPYYESISGAAYIIQVQAKRSGVVYNNTFFVTAHRSQNGQITKVNGSKYGSNIGVRILVDNDGNSYFDIYDACNSIDNTTTQLVKCSFIGINTGTMSSANYYTVFTDDTTIPTNFALAHQLSTSDAGIDARSLCVSSEGISIRRSSDNAIALTIENTGTSGYKFAASGGGSYFSFWTNNSNGSAEKLKIDKDGHLLPGTTNTQNIGSSSLSWHDLYTNNIYLNRLDSANYGKISFYSPSYYTWFNYMQNVGYASPTGANEVAGTYVKTWALRSLIENATNHGWVWESTTNTANAAPDIKMELSSNTGNFWVKGIGNFDTITIRNTSVTGHINFSRNNWNYITAPTSGTIAFVTNGKTAGSANTDVLISDKEITPGTNLYSSLGSTSRRWSTIYGNTLNLSTGTSGENVFTISSTTTACNISNSINIPFNFNNSISTSGGITATGDVTPSANNTYTSGSSSNRWKNVYGVNADFSGTITSSAAQGTAPFSITSTTKVGNLNADLWDGYHLVVGSTGNAANTIYIL